MGKLAEAQEDGPEALDLEEDQDGEQGEEGDEQEDRGDTVDPELTPENLKKVAGKDGDEEEGEGEPKEEEEDPMPTVPRARLNAEIERRKTLETELATLKSKPAAAEAKEEAPPEQPAFDVKAKRKEYMQAMAEGDFDKAAEIDEEILNYVAEKARNEGAAQAVETMSRSRAEEDFLAAVSETVKKYPWLNDKSDDADLEAIDDVVAFRDFYRKKGLDMAEALRKAADRVAEDREIKAGKAKKDGDEEAEGEKPKKKDPAAERKSEAIARGAKAADQQPPPTKGKGNRTSEAEQLDVEKMSEEEYDKLPEAEKKRLRGD